VPLSSGSVTRWKLSGAIGSPDCPAASLKLPYTSATHLIVSMSSSSSCLQVTLPLTGCVCLVQTASALTGLCRAAQQEGFAPQMPIETRGPCTVICSNVTGPQLRQTLSALGTLLIIALLHNKCSWDG